MIDTEVNISAGDLDVGALIVKKSNLQLHEAYHVALH